MATYYAKRALEILREEGLRELCKKSSRFVMKKATLPGRILAGYQIRMENPEYEPAKIPKIIETSPQRINWRTRLSRKRIPSRDSRVREGLSTPNQVVVGVIGGRWDVYKREWERSATYKSLVGRFKYGKDWSETNKFKNNTIQRLEDLDRLYESIKKKGYIPASELTKNPEENEMTEADPHKKKIRGEKYPDECCIGIGRNGEMIRLAGGNHRVSIAKILDLEKIPVLLLVRHKQWQELRDEIHNNGLPEGRDDLRDHPDLQDVLN